MGDSRHERKGFGRSMKREFLYSIIVGLHAAFTFNIQADLNETLAVECNKAEVFAGYLAEGDAEDARRYAPSPLVDITHVTIDVTPDYDARTIAGTTTIEFTVVGLPLTEF